MIWKCDFFYPIFAKQNRNNEFQKTTTTIKKIKIKMSFKLYINNLGLAAATSDRGWITMSVHQYKQ